MNSLIFPARFLKSSQFVLLLGLLGSAASCRSQGAPMVPAVAPAAGTMGGFQIRDQIGRAWSNEVVTFKATPADLKNAEAKRALVGPDGKPVSYQLVPGANGGTAEIAFSASVAPYQAVAYRFGTVSAPAATDLKIEEAGDTIRLSNNLTGIAIRKTLAEGNAPIESIRLASGSWVGGSRLGATPKVASYRAIVTARGPVFWEVLCETKFANGKEWRLRARVEANEPVVLVSEDYALGDESAWTLDLSQNFTPEYVYSRLGRGSAAGRVGVPSSWKIGPDAEPVFVLEPWLRWWMRDRQGNWFGLYNSNSSDLLALAALRPAQWLDPKKENRENTTVPVTLTEGKPQAAFTLKDGARHWMIASLDKAASIKDLEGAGKVELNQAPLPQQYLIKHGDFPLDMVKDYVLDWKSDDSRFPRLLLTKAELARLRANFKADPAKLEALMKLNISVFNVGPPLKYYLASGDEKLGRRLAEYALPDIEHVAQSYLLQGPQMTLGFAPHHNRTMQASINVADAVWPILTPAERTKVKAQIAFMGYTFDRDDYWSPERGYAANPNMTSMVAGYQAQTGMMLLSHPRANAWADKGLKELKHELDEWSDTEGGWLEAPAYAMASYDFLLGMFLTAHNTGHAEYLYEPRMKKIADWFAGISTPPDSRAGGIRHFPPIGNTYINQPTGEFGILAYLWKDKDPDFAARMQWMDKQHSSYPEAGIGGFSPSLTGYRDILLDAAIPAKKPDYRSTLYPETGVLLRNGVDDRETQLHMIAGDNHAHYDMDSGSVTVWGKGRIVADDFGYYGLAPAEDHNMVETPLTAGGLSVMKVQSFTTDPNFDYVQGVKGGWQRRIAFVKDADMLAPNYFVIRESLDVPAPAKWRMWLNAAKIELGKNSALVTGKEDVDTDIIFVSPTDAVLKTEEKTKTTYGLDAKFKYDRMSTSQTGVIASVEKGRSFIAVLFPRLKTQKPPVVTALADGTVLKVQHEAGTDYIFLGDKPFNFKQDGIDFQGTSGVVKLRGTQTQLALGEGGKISAGGQTKEKAGAAPRKLSYNLIENGDIETSAPIPFQSGKIQIAVQDGNPSTEGDVPKGRYSMAFTRTSESGPNSSVILPMRFYVDTAKTYRVRLKGYTSSKITLTLGGQATSDGRDQLKTTEGKLWSYSLALYGPTKGWQQLETTIGPPGSKAAVIWPDKALSTTLGLWVSGDAGTLYLDDFVFEPITD